MPDSGEGLVGDVLEGVVSLQQSAACPTPAPEEGVTTRRRKKFSFECPWLEGVFFLISASCGCPPAYEAEDPGPVEEVGHKVGEVGQPKGSQWLHHSHLCN